MTNRPATDSAGLGAPWSGSGAVVTVSGGSVMARFGDPPGGGPDYTGELVCTWRHAHVPFEADAALVGVLVDHATASVHRERTTTRVTDPDVAGQVRLALDGTQRVAAAAGILMALYHLSPAQARRSLARAGPGPVTTPTAACGRSPTLSCAPGTTGLRRPSSGPTCPPSMTRTRVETP